LKPCWRIPFAQQAPLRRFVSNQFRMNTCNLQAIADIISTQFLTVPAMTKWWLDWYSASFFAFDEDGLDCGSSEIMNRF
jgi:hypothetical protein